MPVSEAYEFPFAFTGTIRKVVVDTTPAKLTAADRRAIEQRKQRMAAATE